jgi:hypothetical protein
LKYSLYRSIFNSGLELWDIEVYKEVEYYTIDELQREERDAIKLLSSPLNYGN